MTRIRRRNIISLVLVLGLCLGVVFISSRRFAGQVIVTNAAGQPVAGAKVVAASLSIESNPSTTDTAGRAILHRYNGVQDVKWIRISAPGYQSAESDVPKNWPLRVTLQTAAGQ